jgi:hypothetical protein
VVPFVPSPSALFGRMRCIGANGVDEVVAPRARLLRDQ